MNEQTKMTNTVLGVLAVLMWSMCSAWSRVSSEAFGPWLTLALVQWIGWFTVLLAAVFQKGEARMPWKISPKRALLISLFVLYVFMLYVAVGHAANREQAIVVTLLNGLWPSLVLLGSAWLFHLRVKPWFALGQLLALAGAYLAVAPSSNLLDAIQGEGAWTLLIGFSSGFVWSAYSNLSRKWPEETHGIMLHNLFFSGLIASCFCLPLDWASLKALPGVPEIFYLGIATNVAFLFWAAAMKKGNATFVALFAYSLPVFSTLFMSFYLSTSLTIALGFAAILIGASALICKVSIQEN